MQLNEYWRYLNKSWWHTIKLKWKVVMPNLFWPEEVLRVKNIVEWITSSSLLSSWYWDLDSWKMIFCENNWIYRNLSEDKMKEIYSFYDIDPNSHS